MDEKQRSASRTGSIDDKIVFSPTVIRILKLAAAVTATIIPACEGYFHARSGLPTNTSFGYAALVGTAIGIVIEGEKSVERVKTTGVISEGILKDGYRIFRWPIGVTAAYLGMYHVGYFVGGLSKN